VGIRGIAMPARRSALAQVAAGAEASARAAQDDRPDVGIARRAPSWAFSSMTSGALSAFSASGRLSVSVRTPSSRLRSTGALSFMAGP